MSTPPAPGGGIAPPLNTSSPANPYDFAVAVLRAGHWKVTPSNIQFLMGWQQAEGQWGATGPYFAASSHNPLNTGYVNHSTALPGYGFKGGVNTAKVQSYPTWQDGIYATVNTLNENYYGNITKALASGNAMGANTNGKLSNALSTWSGGAYNQAPVPGGATPTPNAASVTGNPGTAPSTSKVGLMGNCGSYRTSSAATSNCIIGGGGGIIGIPCVLNACNAKALASGFLIIAGGVTLLVGVALLFAGGKSALAGVAKGAATGGLGFVPGTSASKLAGANYARSQSSPKIGTYIPAESGVEGEF